MLNKSMIIGHLGRDPEIRYVNDNPVCNFSVATTERWKDKQGEQKERTEWHRVQVWGKQAEACSQYLSKGSLAYVEGRIQTREWEDKEGNKRYTTEINAQNVRFLSTRQQGEQSERQESLPADSDDTWG